MHRKHQIAALVYDALFPNPRPEDPTSFSAHLNRNLVGEVRIETATFYGSLDTIEARYPGLNYSHPPHRKRLGRFPHHARLFKVFDDLGLTEHEIATFCRWEGTLWARERYERDEGVKVEDTTGMEIGEWVDRRKQRASQAKGIKVKTDIEVEIEDARAAANDTSALEQIDQNMTEAAEEDEAEESDEETESVGYELNQRLMEAAAIREHGVEIVMDPEWEQYLKDAQEREQRASYGGASLPASQHYSTIHGLLTPSSATSSNAIHGLLTPNSAASANFSYSPSSTSHHNRNPPSAR